MLHCSTELSLPPTAMSLESSAVKDTAAGADTLASVPFTHAAPSCFRRGNGGRDIDYIFQMKTNLLILSVTLTR